MLAKTNWNPVNPVGSCGNVAQAGAAMAVAVKSKSVKMKSLAYPSSVSALLGITEPAVFGVNLRLVSPFCMRLLRRRNRRLVSSNSGIKRNRDVNYWYPGNVIIFNEQFPLYILVNVVAFGAAFALTYVFGMKGDVQE